MKKKLIILLLSSTFVMSSCGSTQSSDVTQSEVSSDAVIQESLSTDTQLETTEKASADFSEFDALGSVEVEEGLFNVELTIPKDYIGDVTQAALDEIAIEKGFKSITLNADGSATYIMTKAQHQDMLSELSDSINSNLSEMIASEDYPNITDITANDDFTSFSVTTKSTELSTTESFSVITFYMYGGMYNIFAGTPVDNIHVDFINADSYEIISSADSANMD